MFLKLFKLDKPAAAEPLAAEVEAAPVAAPAAPSEADAAAPPPVPATANDTGSAEAAVPEIGGGEAPAAGFVTTDNLEPLEGPLGQDAALKALRLGAGIKGPGFHVLAVGAGNAQMTAAARHVLEPIAVAAEPPPEWVYVSDFDSPQRRRALRLPSGAAAKLADGLAEVVAELKTALPRAFASDDYRLRRRAIDEEARAGHEQRLDAFTLAAEAQNIAVLRTPTGYALAPMHDGKVVKPDVFQRLPDHMRQDVEKRVTALQAELTTLLGSGPAIDRDSRRRAAALDEETARYVVEPIIADLAARFADVPQVVAFLAALADDIGLNVQAFVSAAASSGQPGELTRYLAAVPSAAARQGSGAPLVIGGQVTPERLFGEAVACREAPAGVSVKTGLLAAANGGYLVLDACGLDARGLAAGAALWPQLKRALSDGELVPLARTAAGAAHIEFEPIPLKVKIVLLGDAAAEARLMDIDPGFRDLFGVTARFESGMRRDAAAEHAFACAVAAIVHEHDLLPFDAGAVARVITDRTTDSGGGPCLSLDHGALVELAREADYWARERDTVVVTARDVETTLAERAVRQAPAAAGKSAESGSAAT